MFGQLKLIALLAGGTMTVGVLLFGAYQAYAYGYEAAELRCERRVQAIKDEVAERNARIRDEAARRRAETDRLLDARTEDAKAAARREAEWRKRVDDYEAKLRTRGDSCPLTEEDVRALQ